MNVSLKKKIAIYEEKSFKKGEKLLRNIEKVKRGKKFCGLKSFFPPFL